MKQTKCVFEMNGLLKWLAKSVLILGLITFSGHVSESRPFNFESTKTELSELRNASSKKIFNLEKVFNGLRCSLSPPISQIENFIFFLHYQENRIAVKFKSNFEALPINEEDGFLIFYSTKVSEEFDTNHILG